ncbi:MAG: hypothetical protein LBT01_08350 [Spirochaetaceae bacterium]|jgi:hypothetical protein|nr:hypothetical protein [Spirochaetaceae bacterium]
MNKTNMMKRVIFFILFCAPLWAVFANEGGESAKKNSGVLHSDEAPLEELDTILSEKDFGELKNKWRISLKNHEEEKAEEKIDRAPWVSFLNFLFSYFLRILVVAFVIAAIIFIIMYYKKYFVKKSASKKKPRIAAHLSGEESAEALLEEAAFMYKEGKHAESWGLCYRSALVLFSKRSIAIPVAATEYDCLQLIACALPSRKAEFERLVMHRIESAYRSIVPCESEFYAAIAFCRAIMTDAGREKNAP